MTHHDLRPGHVLGDRYRLDRSLGSGGTGTVYAAEDLLLARPVAIKVVEAALLADDERAEQVRRAGSLMASVTHPGFVTVYDATRLDDRFCIVMELVPGPNLRDLIADGGVSPQLVARIGAQVAGALDRLHEMGHAHGSVSPSNVLVAPIGSGKLVDVGLGAALADGGGTADPARDVRDLASALRAALANPDAPGSGDLVDVLDAASHDSGMAWSAGQLADALQVIAEGSRPAAVPAGTDRDATAVMAAVEGPVTTQVMRAADTAEVPVVGVASGEQAYRADAASGESQQPPTTERPLRPSWFLRAMVVIAALAVIGIVVTRGDRQAGQGGGAGGQPVAIAAASDFDPLGGGGEHGDEVPLAYDGDPATAWTTEGYEQPNLGGIKPGVGIWFDLGSSTSIARIDLAMYVAGSDFSIYAFDEEPQGGDAAAWGEPVATVTQAGSTEAIDVSGGSGRYWLVWLTNLGPDAGRYRGGVAEITFVGS